MSAKDSNPAAQKGSMLDGGEWLPNRQSRYNFFLRRLTCPEAKPRTPYQCFFDSAQSQLKVNTGVSPRDLHLAGMKAWQSLKASGDTSVFESMAATEGWAALDGLDDAARDEQSHESALLLADLCLHRACLLGGPVGDISIFLALGPPLFQHHNSPLFQHHNSEGRQGEDHNSEGRQGRHHNSEFEDYSGKTGKSGHLLPREHTSYASSWLKPDLRFLENGQGETPLVCAIRGRAVAVTRLLLKGQNADCLAGAVSPWLDRQDDACFAQALAFLAVAVVPTEQDTAMLSEWTDVEVREEYFDGITERSVLMRRLLWRGVSVQGMSVRSIREHHWLSGGTRVQHRPSLLSRGAHRLNLILASGAEDAKSVLQLLLLAGGGVVGGGGGQSKPLLALSKLLLALSSPAVESALEAITALGSQEDGDGPETFFQEVMGQQHGLWDSLHSLLGVSYVLNVDLQRYSYSLDQCANNFHRESTVYHRRRSKVESLEEAAQDMTRKIVWAMNILIDGHAANRQQLVSSEDTFLTETIKIDRIYQTHAASEGPWLQGDCSMVFLILSEYLRPAFGVVNEAAAVICSLVENEPSIQNRFITPSLRRSIPRLLAALEACTDEDEGTNAVMALGNLSNDDSNVNPDMQQLIVSCSPADPHCRCDEDDTESSFDTYPIGQGGGSFIFPALVALLGTERDIDLRQSAVSTMRDIVEDSVELQMVCLQTEGCLDALAGLLSLKLEDHGSLEDVTVEFMGCVLDVAESAGMAVAVLAQGSIERVENSQTNQLNQTTLMDHQGLVARLLDLLDPSTWQQLWDNVVIQHASEETRQEYAETNFRIQAIELQATASWALGNMCERNPGNQGRMCAIPGALPGLVRQLSLLSPPDEEAGTDEVDRFYEERDERREAVLNAAEALLNIAANNLEAQAAIMHVPEAVTSMTQALNDSFDDGSVGHVSDARRRSRARRVTARNEGNDSEDDEWFLADDGSSEDEDDDGGVAQAVANLLIELGSSDLVAQLPSDAPLSRRPASQACLSALPMVCITAEDTCSVCLDKLVPGTFGKQLPCRHVLHEECLMPWLRRVAECPVCRAPVRE